MFLCSQITVEENIFFKSVSNNGEELIQMFLKLIHILIACAKRLRQMAMVLILLDNCMRSFIDYASIGFVK